MAISLQKILTFPCSLTGPQSCQNLAHVNTGGYRHFLWGLIVSYPNCFNPNPILMKVLIS